jgi:LemA protein
MHLVTIIIIAGVAVGALVLLWLLRSARRLRRTRNDLDRDWSEMERLFKQRQDELPRLVQTCRSFMPADAEVFRQLLAARVAIQSSVTLEQKARAEEVLRESILGLVRKAKQLPELERNATFSQLEARFEEIEERIAERSESYHDDVVSFNSRLARFPTSLPARIAKLTPRPLFEAKNERRETKPS